MSSDKNQAVRVLRLIESLFALERSGARDWSWIAARLQEVVDIPNHLKSRRQIFVPLEEWLTQKYITFGHRAAREAAEFALGHFVLGVGAPEYWCRQLERIHEKQSLKVCFVEPWSLNRIDPSSIAWLFRDFDLEIKSPGIHSMATVNEITQELASSLAREVLDVYGINESWMLFLREYFRKLLSYTILYSLHHDTSPREPYFLYKTIVNETYQKVSGGMNIPLGYRNHELLILCSDKPAE